MGFGREDWTPVGLGTNQATLQDMAELAVRLGSIVNYDRSAKTIFKDEFNYLDSLYTLVQVGVTGAPAVVSDYSSENGKSLQFTLGVGIANHIYMTRILPYWNGTIASWEMKWVADQVPDDIEIYWRKVVNGKYHIYNIRLYDSGKILQVSTSGGTWVTLETFASSPMQIRQQHILRLNVNIADAGYSKVQFNHYSYDVSGYTLATGNYPYYAENRVSMYFYGNALNPIQYNLDHVLLSEDI